MLRTISRVLNALQESYPGLYVLPEPYSSLPAGQIKERRQDIILDIISSQQLHLNILDKVCTAATSLQSTTSSLAHDHCIECLLGLKDALVAWHEHVICSLQNLSAAESNEWEVVDWERVFRIDVSRQLFSYL